MKKIILSAAVAAMALSTSAFAADKGIDVVTTGQAVVYYQTGDQNDNSIGSQDNSSANVGLQLNLDADLKSGFTFGSQLTYLGTAGLEKNLVSGTRQGTTNDAYADNSTTDELALTKIFVAKTVGNTTVKIGRQELPKSLAPFSYSEGWNVFKNTFDAILAVNTDIPDTTLVGAYVSGGTGMDLTATDNLVAGGTGLDVLGAAYMITAQNKSIPMTTITASYYDVDKVQVVDNATALWVDAKIAGKDMPLGLKIGLQGGQISGDAVAEDTTAMGVKVGMKPIKPLYLQLAYSNVNDGDQAVKNVGTGIKTPLFTQMIYNQNAIARDNSTIVAKAVYNTGDYGKIIAQYGMTTAGDTNNINGENDYTELDVIYRIKSGGVAYWASVMMINADVNGAKSSIIGAAADAESDTKIRLWGRYAF